MRFVSFVLLLWLLSGPVLAQEPATLSNEDRRALLETVMRNQRRFDGQLSEYTSNGKQVTRYYDDKGKLKEETIILSESYQSFRRNVEVVLSKNGKPYSEGKIKKEREEAVKKLSEDEKERAQMAKTSVNTEGPELGIVYGQNKIRTIRLATFDLYRAGEFFNPRNEQWRGRKMIVLDFRPRADFEPKDQRLTPLKHLAGTVWIDAEQKVTAKLLAYLVSDQQRQKTAYHLESVRLPDGTWLVKRSGFNATLNPQAFNGLNLEWFFERTNYQRFTAQAGDVKLDSPPQKP